MVTTISIQEDIYQAGITAIVQSGLYPDQSAILLEAFQLFLQAHPQIRLIMAIDLYQNEVVTLSKAAEIAEMNFFDFRAILQARGIMLESSEETTEDIQRGVALILEDT